MAMLTLLLAVVWTMIVAGLDTDPNGYILYCPCMGRFGNQADQFLGALAFAKALDRTLVLPPWVEYIPRNVHSVQVPFDTYFKVEPLQEYHRALTMEKFMSELAPTVWPPGQRVSLCYSARPGPNSKGDSCNAKDGNPFGPFWNTFGVDFDTSDFYSPLYFDVSSTHEVKRWREKYPPGQWPVLAFTGAPGSFPISKHNVYLQRFLHFSQDLESRADKFIQDNFNGEPFVGIHLRNGVDFRDACKHIDESPMMFGAAQCLGHRGEHGKATKQMCYPDDSVVVQQVKAEVKRIKAKGVFIATDDRDLIDQLSKAMKKVKFVKQTESVSPHLDLAILSKADHFIGNCISTFTAFVKRARDVHKATSTFWAFKPRAKKDEL